MVEDWFLFLGGKNERMNEKWWMMMPRIRAMLEESCGLYGSYVNGRRNHPIRAKK
jgi:hypothetical protein